MHLSEIFEHCLVSILGESVDPDNFLQEAVEYSDTVLAKLGAYTYPAGTTDVQRDIVTNIMLSVATSASKSREPQRKYHKYPRFLLRRGFSVHRSRPTYSAHQLANGNLLLDLFDESPFYVEVENHYTVALENFYSWAETSYSHEYVDSNSAVTRLFLLTILARYAPNEPRTIKDFLMFAQETVDSGVLDHVANRVKVRSDQTGTVAPIFTLSDMPVRVRVTSQGTYGLLVLSRYNCIEFGTQSALENGLMTQTRLSRLCRRGVKRVLARGGQVHGSTAELGYLSKVLDTTRTMTKRASAVNDVWVKSNQVKRAGEAMRVIAFQG